MSCFTKCQDLQLFNYKTNKTIEMEYCTCTGCCYNINSFFQFMAVCSFFFISFLYIDLISRIREKQRTEIMEDTRLAPTEPLPAYTENV